MGTKAQERKERDVSRTHRLSVINTWVLILTFCFTVGWQIYQRYSYEKQFGSIEASIRLLTATVAPQLQKAIDDSLVSALNGTQPQASQALAKVEDDTRSLRKLNAKLPVTDVNQTALLLEKATNLHSDIPYAWGAAAQMVSYRSELRNKTVERPDCYKTQGGGDWHLSSPVMKYHDCTLNLDDVAEFNAVAPYAWQGPYNAPTATGRVVPTIFLQNGTVTYSGGKMIDIEKVVCQNCSFNLRSPEAIPPPPGRALSQQLLLADLADVSLSLPGKR